MNIEMKRQVIRTLTDYERQLSPQDADIVAGAPNLSRDRLRRFQAIYEAVKGGRYERPPYFGLSNLTLDNNGTLYYKGVGVDYIMVEYGNSYTLDSRRIAQRALDRCRYLKRIGTAPSMEGLGDDWAQYAQGYLLDCMERVRKLAREDGGLLFTSVFVGCGFGGTTQFLMPGNPTLDEIRQSEQYKDFLPGNDLEIYLIKDVYGTGPGGLLLPTPEQLAIMQACFSEMKESGQLHPLASLRYDYEENSHKAEGTVVPEVSDYMAADEPER